MGKGRKRYICEKRIGGSFGWRIDPRYCEKKIDKVELIKNV